MLNVVICDDSTRDASQLEQYLLSYDKVPVETKLYTNPQKMLEQLTSCLLYTSHLINAFLIQLTKV